MKLQRLLSQIMILGKGSYGTVYFQKCGGSEMAVKHIEQTPFNPTEGLNEIEFGSLFHPSIVGMVDFDLTDSKLKIGMEYYPKTLQQVNHETPIVSILADVLLGLEFLHGMKIFHRDLKPDNILVRDDRAVLCDFGMAGHSFHPFNVGIAGTDTYRAPEMSSDTKSYTTAVDVWSLGCTIIDVFLPAEQRPKLYHRRRPSSIRSFKEKMKEFPLWESGLVEIVEMCLQVDHGKRATCTTLLNLPFFDPVRERICETRSKFYPRRGSTLIAPSHQRETMLLVAMKCINEYDPFDVFHAVEIMERMMGRSEITNIETYFYVSMFMVHHLCSVTRTNPSWPTFTKEKIDLTSDDLSKIQSHILKVCNLNLIRESLYERVKDGTPADIFRRYSELTSKGGMFHEIM